MPYKTFDVSVTDGIGLIQFNRPEKLNSLSLDFWGEFAGAIAALDKSARARVLVIAAQGEHFCAGMDLSVFDGLIGSDAEAARSKIRFRERVLGFQRVLTSLEEFRMPVIAAMQGACIGGGVGLASVCDLRYCTEDSFFSIEEINIGVACDIGTLQRLPHQISETHLREWAYTGDRLTAEKALCWGFVGEVYQNHTIMMAEVMAEVMALAKKIASKSPVAVHGCKVSMNFSRDHTVQEGLDHVALWSSAMLEEGEIQQAMAARKSGTPANFSGLLPKAD